MVFVLIAGSGAAVEPVVVLVILPLAGSNGGVVVVVNVTMKLVGELIHMMVPSAPPPWLSKSPIDEFNANAAWMVTIWLLFQEFKAQVGSEVNLINKAPVK